MKQDEITNSVCHFDTLTGEISVPRVTGTPPPACLSAEAAIIGSTMFVLGGWTHVGLADGFSCLKLDCDPQVDA